MALQTPTHYYSYEEVEGIAKFLLSKQDSKVKPKIGIVCGTGLGKLADALEERLTVDYKDIPNFPLSTVHGHAGKLVFGTIHNKQVVCMQGRFHMYEGYHMSQVTLPIRVMKLMGVQILFVTNAAGSLNEKLTVGDMMLIKDQIFMPGLAGHNPLVGPNDERFGPRFHAMSDVYTPDLRRLAKQAYTDLKFGEMSEGVYAMNGGPSFESVAECRLLKSLGADVVGMSTCPETIIAAHCGMKVFGMSLVTNDCVLDYDNSRVANHAEVLEAGSNRAKDIQSFIIKLVQLIPDSMVSQ